MELKNGKYLYHDGPFILRALAKLRASVHHADAREMKGPGFPVTSGNEVLVISSKNEFSKTCMGGWDVTGFIGMELRLSGFKVPFSPSQFWKKGSWEFRRRSSVEFLFHIAAGVVQHSGQITVPQSMCGAQHGRAPCGYRKCIPLQQESQQGEESLNFHCLELYQFRFLSLQ